MVCHAEGPSTAPGAARLSPITILIAAGLGYFAYADAKRFVARGTPVRPFSPAGWGICVALVAIVFGIWYIIARRKVLSALPPDPPGSHGY